MKTVLGLKVLCFELVVLILKHLLLWQLYNYGNCIGPLFNQCDHHPSLIKSGLFAEFSSCFSSANVLLS